MKQTFKSEYLDDDWKKLIIRYEHPNPVEAVIKDFKIKIIFHGPSISNIKINQLTISYETKVEIAFDEDKPFENCISIIRRLQNFFGLAMGMPTYPITVTGVSDANKIKTEDGEDFSMPIEIYFPAVSWPENLIESHSSQMLLPLPKIEENFETYLYNWMEKYDKLEPSINLYFSVLYSPNSYMELKFLSLTQALETYHRRVFEIGKYQSDEEYQSGLYLQLVNVLPQRLDEGFRTSLKKGKLKYANEFSLRTRLKKILMSIIEELAFSFVSVPEERDIFIDKVAHTRNYWTHYTAELADMAAQNEDRSTITISLQLILEVCFLKELGIESAKIKSIIQRSDRFQRLKYRLQQ